MDAALDRPLAVADQSDAGGGSAMQGVASRLARLLDGGGERLGGEGHGGLVAEPVVRIAVLPKAAQPAEVWAIDGGQATVADARCVTVVVVRVARACWRNGACFTEKVGPLRPYLLGGDERRATLADLANIGLDLPADTVIDANLLRDAAEWDALARTVEEAEPGALVLVDGDLRPDWRIPGAWAARILARAAERGVVVAAVTKHSGLARGGAPLVAALEAEAEADPALGSRARWWAAVAHTGPGVEPPLRVAVARLDPSARFAFRVDVPAPLAPPAPPAPPGLAQVLAMLAAVSDDAAFPGYPYPLSVVDGLAACPPWVRQDARLALDEHLDKQGVGLVRRERYFTDRHRLMERA
ncbi:MAG: hypothetical protein ACRDWV_06065 [Acidimicrobiales bacterium]